MVGMICTVEMRVWERGGVPAMTRLWHVGTGALCGVAVASILNGYVKVRGSDS